MEMDARVTTISIHVWVDLTGPALGITFGDPEQTLWVT